MKSSNKSFGLMYQFLRLVLQPWVSRLRPLKADLEKLRELQQSGQLLLVGQWVSFIDFLAINEYLRVNGYQPVSRTHGINPFLVLPLKQAWSHWITHIFKSKEERYRHESERLFLDIQAGEHAFLFLKRAPKLGSSRVFYFKGMLGRIAEGLSEREKSTFLVPTSVFLTRRRKSNTPRTFFEIFFGTYDFPGRFRKLWHLLTGATKGGLVFSRHIDLGAEIGEEKRIPLAQAEKRLRWTLLFHLDGEDRAYRGPTKRTVERKVRKILKERRLNEELKKVAERQNRPLESVTKEAKKTLHHIASDTSDRMINFLRMVFDFVWARTVEGIDIHQEDLDRVRELNKEGPVVLLPCHRSHVDYLVLAYSFEKAGLNNPRFAAGENLSKWPMGIFLRRAGAFFIRRSFKGEVVFPLVFEAYIRHILRQRNIVAFFMEGGRSRTGKVLHPKIGMVGMVVDAWRQGFVKDLPLVPVTVDYGKVFEGKAYLQEKSGGEKKQENLGAMIRSSRVLKKKHGVIRLRFGKAVQLSDFAESKGLNRDQLGFKTKIPFLHDLSFRLMDDINKMVTLTAGNILAALLLGNPKRGMTLTELRALFVIAVRYLHHRKVELAFTEKRLDLALENALDTFEKWETIVRVEVGGEVVINIPEAKRSEMEYYKNNGLHFILELALFCQAFLCLSPERRTLNNIRDLAQQLYRYLTEEFLAKDLFVEEDHINRAFRALEVIDALAMKEDVVIFGEYKAGRSLVQVLGHLLLNFMESYFVVAEEVSKIDAGEGIDRKKLLRQCMTKSKLLYAVGTVRRQEAINQLSFGNAITWFSKNQCLKLKNIQGQKYPMVLISEEQLKNLQAAKDQLFEWITLLD